MRLFIALPCPPEVRRRLALVQKNFSSCGSFKFVEEENIHITLKFLGEVSADTAEKIRQALAAMQEEPSFSVRLQGLGVFPKPSFPRVVWVGVTEGSERVDALHVRADELLKTLGFPPDERFHPHATVVRVKYVADKGKLARFLEGEKNSDYGTYTADRVSLMESKLSPEGPKYNTLKDYSLKCA